MTSERDQEKKAAAAGDPVAERIRARRTQLGWSLAELAEEAGLRAPSYVFHIEAGEKIPSEDVARRLADALGEDREVFEAWARLRGRSDLRSAMSAARTLDERLAARAVERILADPAHEVSFDRAEILRLELPGREEQPFHRVSEREARAFYEPTEDAELSAASESLDDVMREPARSLPGLEPSRRIPSPHIDLLPERADPDDPKRAAGRAGRLRFRPGVLERHPKVVQRLRSLDRPFAYRLHRRNTARTKGFLPPRHFAVLTRQVLPVDLREAYAVRTGRGVELGQVRWDGERLLLLPSPGDNDFEVFPASSEKDLLRHIAGKVEILVPVEAVLAG